MPTSVTVRVSRNALGHTAGSYEHLLRRAAAYARDHLAGLTVVNHATQLSISLTPKALRAATQYGTATALLRALPALPSLLEEAGYVRSSADRRHAVGARGLDLRDTRKLHLLGTTADVAGRHVKLLFTVRENFGGQCFLDRITAPDAPDRRRQDGGGIPGGATPADDSSEMQGGPPVEVPDGAAARASDPASDAASAAPQSGQDPAMATIQRAYEFGDDIYDKYHPNKQSRPPLSEIDTDREAYGMLQRQLADIAASDDPPTSGANSALWAQRASYYLYSAAINRGLADAGNIPDAVTSGFLGVSGNPFSRDFFKR